MIEFLENSFAPLLVDLEARFLSLESYLFSSDLDKDTRRQQLYELYQSYSTVKDEIFDKDAAIQHYFSKEGDFNNHTLYVTHPAFNTKWIDVDGEVTQDDSKDNSRSASHFNARGNFTT